MISRSKHHCLALVVTLGISLLSAGAFAQDTGASGQRQQNAQAPAESMRSACPSVVGNSTIYPEVYAGFFQLIGREEERNEHLIEIGEPTIPRLDLARILGLPEHEQQVIRDICHDGDNRIVKLDMETAVARNEADRNYNQDTEAKRLALIQRRPQLIASIIAELQKALRPEDFKKLTIYANMLSPCEVGLATHSPGSNAVPTPTSKTLQQ